MCSMLLPNSAYSTWISLGVEPGSSATKKFQCSTLLTVHEERHWEEFQFRECIIRDLDMLLLLRVPSSACNLRRM